MGKKSIIKNIDYTDLTYEQIMEKKAKMLEVMKWLYLNDKTYGSAKEWRKALVEFLEGIL